MKKPSTGKKRATRGESKRTAQRRAQRLAKENEELRAKMLTFERDSRIPVPKDAPVQVRGRKLTRRISRTMQDIERCAGQALAGFAGGNAPTIDLVNHPPHYVDGPSCDHCGKPIECITIARSLPFQLGNVVKYVWRADKKGDAKSDLAKAIWYLNDYIAKLRAS